MATISDIGVPGQPLNTPPLTGWQAAVRDHLLKDAWVPFNPTLSGFTCSAVSAWYARSAGGVVHVNAVFTITAVTGTATFVLPVPSLGDAQGSAMLICGGGNYVGQTRIAGATATCAIDAINASATYATRNNLGATVPGTWAAGDKIIVSITYRAADL